MSSTRSFDREGIVVFRIDRQLESLTPQGLTRRISTLRRVLLENATTHERKSV
jgi:hypothetical protein